MKQPPVQNTIRPTHALAKESPVCLSPNLYTADIVPFKIIAKDVLDYAIIRLDNDGMIISWNAGAEKIKGYCEQEITGKNFAIFYSEGDRSDRLPEKLLAQAGVTGRVVDEGWRVRKDGSRFWALVTITKITGSDGACQGFVKITRDITDKRTFEGGLISNEKHFRSLFNATHQFILLIDADGLITEINQTILDFAQITKEYIVGKSFLGGHWCRYTQKTREKFTKALSLAIKGQSTKFEAEIMYHSDRKAIVEFCIKPFSGSHTNAVVIIEGHDITETKSLQANLIAATKRNNKLLRLAALNLHERERSKIAYVLNENVNQILAACRLFLEQSGSDLSSDTKTIINSISSHIKQVIEENKKICSEINPAILNVIGLKAAVSDLTKNLTNQEGLQFHINFEDELERKMSTGRKTALYRIIQEQVSNAIAHSHARLVNLKLAIFNTDLVCLYSDDGVGFSKPRSEWGLGLQNIQNLVDLMDGSLKIHSFKGMGCTMTIKMPYRC